MSHMSAWQYRCKCLIRKEHWLLITNDPQIIRTLFKWLCHLYDAWCFEWPSMYLPAQCSAPYCKTNWVWFWLPWKGCCQYNGTFSKCNNGIKCICSTQKSIAQPNLSKAVACCLGMWQHWYYALHKMASGCSHIIKHDTNRDFPDHSYRKYLTSQDMMPLLKCLEAIIMAWPFLQSSNGCKAGRLPILKMNWLPSWKVPISSVNGMYFSKHQFVTPQWFLTHAIRQTLWSIWKGLFYLQVVGSHNWPKAHQSIHSKIS